MDTTTQRLEALAKANAVRMGRRRIKDLVAGDRTGLVTAELIARGPAALPPALADAGDVLERTEVGELIQAIPLFGPSRARAVLREAAIAHRPHAALEALSARQRHAIAAALERRYHRLRKAAA
jgi:hypothetical protein